MPVGCQIPLTCALRTKKRQGRHSLPFKSDSFWPESHAARDTSRNALLWGDNRHPEKLLFFMSRFGRFPIIVPSALRPWRSLPVLGWPRPC